MAAGGGVQGVRAVKDDRAGKLGDTSSTKVTLPFVEERLMEARALMGEDFWPYGVAANRKTLETFLRHHHAQGLSPRLVKVEECSTPARWRRTSFSHLRRLPRRRKVAEIA